MVEPGIPVSIVSFTLLVLCLFIGLLGVLPGILPSIFLFRDLANGTDGSHRTKRAYAWVLWSGMAAGWAIASFVTWLLLNTWIVSV